MFFIVCPWHVVDTIKFFTLAENWRYHFKTSTRRCGLEELIDRTLTIFLEQVKDGRWTSGGWPQTYTDYSMSKLAVNAFTRLISKMFSDRPEGQKIYINCYCPGWVKTAMTGWAGHTSPKEGADTGVWLDIHEFRHKKYLILSFCFFRCIIHLIGLFVHLCAKLAHQIFYAMVPIILYECIILEYCSFHIDYHY